ncbi:MAG: hypothetical protein AAFX55_20125 [Bacteroidota bacterium]
MCEIKNEFLLCSCQANGLKENDVSWILFRRKENNKRGSWHNSKPIKRILGQRELPSNDLIESGYKARYYKSLKTFYEEKTRKKELEDAIRASEDYLKTTAYILTELNTRNCFDKDIEVIEKDVLSIKLNSELGLWVEFIYRKKSWKIAKFSLDEKKYLTIIKGEIKSTHNNR